MMHRAWLVTVLAALSACTSKRVVPDDMATSTTGAIGSTLAESMLTSSGSSDSESSDSESTSGTTGVMPPLVPCGDITCNADELCVVPGKVCVHYDSEGCDPNDGIDDPCADDEPGLPPFCAGLPPSCEISDLICIGETLCNQPWTCNEPTPIDGVVDCGPNFCHCP
jgi:hypothetical protein